jgi:hypothetical protein
MGQTFGQTPALTVSVAANVTPGVILGAKQQAVILLANPAGNNSSSSSSSHASVRWHVHIQMYVLAAHMASTCDLRREV